MRESPYGFGSKLIKQNEKRQSLRRTAFSQAHSEVSISHLSKNSEVSISHLSKKNLELLNHAIKHQKKQAATGTAFKTIDEREPYRMNNADDITSSQSRLGIERKTFDDRLSLGSLQTLDRQSAYMNLQMGKKRQNREENAYHQQSFLSVSSRRSVSSFHSPRSIEGEKHFCQFKQTACAKRAYRKALCREHFCTFVRQTLRQALTVLYKSPD